MPLDITPEKFSALLSVLPVHKQAAVAGRMEWLARARPKQIPPQDGNWFVFLALAGRGFGKALALDTPIPTPDGWSTMGALQPGDALFDETGAVCSVVMAHPVQTDRPCYAVRFSDGSEIVADESHLWLTEDRRTRKAMRRRIVGPSDRHSRPQSTRRYAPAVRTTAEIATTLIDMGETNHAVRVASPLQLPTADLPIDPYVLGAWLGDGDSNGAIITSADPEIISEIERRGVPSYPLISQGQCGRATRYRLGSAPVCRDAASGRMTANGSLHSALGALGVRNNKHIPTAYLRASEEQRRALLAGLMDTDGSIMAGGNAEFLGCNLALCKGVLELVRSLGFKPTWAEERATLYGKDCGPRYRVSWTPYVPVFSLPRKLARQHAGGNQADRQRRRFIVAVEPVPSVPVRCITVDSPSRLFLAGEAMIPTHNSLLGAQEAWWHAAWNDGARVAVVAPTAGDLRRVCFEGESGLLNVVPVKCLRGADRSEAYNRSLFELHFENGSVIQGHAASEPERLRGPQFSFCWSDELGAWSDPGAAWDMLMMTLRLGERPRVIATTTPRPIPLIRGLLSREGKDVVVVRGTTYENEANLAPGFIAQLRERYEKTRLGRQELLAELLEDIPGALWTRAMIDAGRLQALPSGLPHHDAPGYHRALAEALGLTRIVVGVDPSGSDGESETADEIGIVAAGVDRADRAYVLEDASGQYSPEGWGRKAVEVYKRWGADRIVAEKNFGGEMVNSTIRAVDRLAPVTLVTASRGKVVRAEPVAALYEQGRVSHLGTFPRLEDQFCAMTRHGYQGLDSPDRLDSATWALTDLLLQETKPYDLLGMVSGGPPITWR